LSATTIGADRDAAAIGLIARNAVLQILRERGQVGQCPQLDAAADHVTGGHTRLAVDAAHRSDAVVDRRRGDRTDGVAHPGAGRRDAEVRRQLLDELADDLVDLGLLQRDRGTVDRNGRPLKDRQDAAESGGRTDLVDTRLNTAGGVDQDGKGLFKRDRGRGD
jgi:hypothetical protein